MNIYQNRITLFITIAKSSADIFNMLGISYSTLAKTQNSKKSKSSREKNTQ